MSTPKADALRAIETLPDDCTWEDIHYRVYVNVKIAQGLADIEAGRVVPHEQVMQEMDAWLASLGRPRPVSSSS